jgi:hypothetical protein
MKNPSALIILLPLLTLDFGLWALDSSAQSVPALINYQGRLSNSDGSPLATSDYQLTFNIYDSSNNSGGLVWGPQIFDGQSAQGHGSRIPVVQGYFNVMLGPTDTNGFSLANAFNDTNRFVEIRIGTNNPIKPRQQILTAPFAFNSAKLAGADWSAVFGTNDPVNGFIPLSKLAPRTTGAAAPLGGIAISATVTTADTSYSSPTTVAGLQVSLVTSNNRPVAVFFVSGATDENNSSESNFEVDNPPDALVSAYRGTICIGAERVQGAGSSTIVPCSSLRFLDLAPPAGTNVYTIKLWSRNNDSSHPFFHNARLVAMEL